MTLGRNSSALISRVLFFLLVINLVDSWIVPVFGGTIKRAHHHASTEGTEDVDGIVHYGGHDNPDFNTSTQLLIAFHECLLLTMVSHSHRPLVITRIPQHHLRV